MNKMFTIFMVVVVCSMFLLGGASGAELHKDAAAEPAANLLQITINSSGCATEYPLDRFRACYFQGSDPYSGSFLSSQEESPLGNPVLARTFGIDHDWGSWSGVNMSAIWRGRLYFEQGRYQFTTFARDGVRLFIDEQLLIDEWIPDPYWYRYGTVEVLEGYHNIRVEWFTAGESAESTILRLHWDRVPEASLPHRVTRMVIDVFILKQQEVCIAGNPWVSGEPVAIYNPDGTKNIAWQREDPDLPRSLLPSDPLVSEYDLVKCFAFGFLPEEIPAVLEEVEGFAELIRNWSAGDIRPMINLFELEGEVGLVRTDTSWWIVPGMVAPLAAPMMTTESDFAILLSSTKDISTGLSYPPAMCGASLGVDYPYNFGGTGFSWVPCIDSLIILHEWEHLFTSAVNHLLQFDSIYPIESPTYPPCGTGDPDIFKWFPDSEHWGTDPDSPWCGPTDVVGIAELHLFAHFDSSLSHYPLGYFTGNHCDDGILDFGESEIDSGEVCPAIAPPEINKIYLPLIDR